MTATRVWPRRGHTHSATGIGNAPRDSAKISEADSSQTTTTSAENVRSPPWRALFFFTTKANVPILLLAIATSVIGGVVSPAQAFITGKVFNALISYASGQITADDLLDQERKWILWLVGVAGGSWLFHFIEFTAWVAFGELQAKSARDRLFHGLLVKEIEWFDMRKNGIGALLPRLQAQIRELQLATSQPLGGLLSLVSTAVLSLAQAFFNSWALTLVTLATTPLIVFVIVWFGKGTQPAVEKQQARLTEAQKYSVSAFSAIETVKCFNGQEMELERYKKKVAEAAIWYYRVANNNALQTGFLLLLAQSMFVQAFYYGGVLISSGEKTAAEVVTTFFSAFGAFQAIQQILPQMLVMEKGRTAGATLRAIMAQVSGGSTIEHDSRLQKPMACFGNIHLKHVSFAYPSRPSQPALDDVTMHIPGGEMTFLIGQSGSGKSTVSQLLLRFYQNSAGRITLDGESLTTLDVKWLRTKITLVEQTSLLFNDTVFRNIAVARPDWEDVTKEEVTSAVEFALLQLMVSDMPHGLDTVVGHKGGAMSGGQRQRVALARARLRDTPILILDESTSALDHISRALMMDAIRQWRKGKTTIIITHDISQIQPDDYVHVLERGRLVQEGYRKHMEKLKDSPFQDFLPPDQRATTSLFDSRKNTTFESIKTRGSSLDTLADPSDHSEAIHDAMDAELSFGESKRASFLPSVLIEGGPVPGMRPYAKPGPSSAVAAPFLRMAVSPPSQLPRYFRRASPTNVALPSRLLSKMSHTSTRSDRSSDQFRALALQDLIEKTGNTAAETRLGVGIVNRRQGVIEATEKVSHARRVQAKGTPTQDLESQASGSTKQQSFKEILGTLWPSISWPIRVSLILGFWGATGHAIATPIFSYVLSKLLALYAQPEPHSRESLVYSMTILGIAALDGLHTYAFRFFLEYVSQCWVDSLRCEAMRRILDQPRTFFEKDENSVSSMTESLDRNAEEMRNLLGRFAGMVHMAAVMIVVSITWALVVQWKLTLIALSVAPYIFFVTNAFSAISEKWEGLSNDASEAASSVFTETFTNIKTVRALTLESHFCSKYITATNHALKVGFLRALFAGFFYGLSDSAGNFSTALVFYVGTRLVQSGSSVFSIVQVFVMLIFTITSVSAILEFIPQIGSAKDTASRLLRLAQLPKESHEHLGDTRVVSIGDVQFHDLHFAYPSRPELQVLRGINLKISPGIKTAIVGGSGSGKSTIANLLLKLYSTAAVREADPRKGGDLMFSGRDIKHIHTGSLRALVAVVSQTPTLFAASISENISYGLAAGSPRNNSAAVVAAARQAGIHDFISSLPLGYETPIGDGGMGVSGGQAQRIAIARALVRKPSVLILDEATSALDEESAGLIRSTIDSLIQDEALQMTVIIITHSREMMEIAGHVIVLDHGRLVESGGFQELLAANGHLSNLLSGGEWTEETNEGRLGQQYTQQGVAFNEHVDWKPPARAKPKLRL